VGLPSRQFCGDGRVDVQDCDETLVAIHSPKNAAIIRWISRLDNPKNSSISKASREARPEMLLFVPRRMGMQLSFPIGTRLWLITLNSEKQKFYGSVSPFGVPVALINTVALAKMKYAREGN